MYGKKLTFGMKVEPAAVFGKLSSHDASRPTLSRAVAGLRTTKNEPAEPLRWHLTKLTKRGTLSPVTVAACGREFFRNAVADADPRWHFYFLPLAWPATALVQFSESGVDLSGTWMPLAIKATIGSVRTSASGDRRFFMYHRIKAGGFPQVFVAPDSGAYFMGAGGSSGALKQLDKRSHIFNESENMPIVDVLDRMREHWLQPHAQRSLGSWFGGFRALASCAQKVQCGAIEQMQMNVYEPLGLHLTFPDTNLWLTYNSYLDNLKIVHRVPSVDSAARFGGSRSLKLSMWAGRGMERSFTRQELNELDLICAMNYCSVSNQLFGFFLFPRAYIRTLFTKTDSLTQAECDETHNRRTYWIHFPESAHRARLDKVKKRHARDMEFYVDLREDCASNALLKVKRILDQHTQEHNNSHGRDRELS
ncbi:unnamed protein product [Amoebophrya sp. A120]|nr:unnamed protein product [Amoebophrya sp. A120]|eukprot:GSA120T00020191001.1